MEHNHIVLASFSADSKLPSVLSQLEVKVTIASCTLLKHRLMIALMYGCGLGLGKLVALKVKSIDLHRGMLQVVQAKGRKDRYVPLGAMLCRGIASHIETGSPKKWLFTSKYS